MQNKNILVHTCCAPCTAYSFERLINNGYTPTAFFYNPNIHPQSEYERRLAEQVRFCSEKNYPLMIQDVDFERWEEGAKDFADQPEGGLRCEYCFRRRLEETAKYAVKNGFNCFTTVLTISPHKNSRIIFRIGAEVGEKYGILFIEENFKKNDGFKKSLIISSEHNLFRQTYCGCTYSI